jgi:PKD repeat protein
VSWNDYESSQQIEAGIDNCVSITPALTGSTLSWQVTGNTATIDHYAVFTSTDGTTLTPIGSVPPTTTNFNLTTANLSPANYAVFIQAVGKPSVLNKISPAVLYAAKQPPTVAVSVSPTSGIAPLAVNASITSSAATGSVISSNSINFGDGTVVNAATATHTYSASGTYTVTATATDNNNLSSTATATVTVAASLQPPTAKLTVTPTSGTAPLAVSASTAGSTDPNTGGSITSTTINFGDGTVVNAATASHTYNSAGTYTVTAKVTDNNNLSSTATATVVVSAVIPPPTGSPTTVTLGGQTYNLQSHPRVWLDGPSGALATSLQNTGTNGKANPSNPPYAAMVNLVAPWVTTNTRCSGTPANPNQCPGASNPGDTFTNARNNALSAPIDAAFLWWAQGANVSDPNGYLAAAKYFFVNDFQSAGLGSFACNEGVNYCGRDLYTTFQPPYSWDGMWTAYSIIRSQLTSGQRQAIANMALNDLDNGHNGLGLQGAPTSACTKQAWNAGTGTISVSGSTVTFGTSGATSVLSAGSQLFINNPSSGAIDFLGNVSAVNSGTQVTLTNVSWFTLSGKTWAYTSAWTTNNCGLLWLFKHHNAFPPIPIASASSFAGNYANGGSYAQPNITATQLKNALMMGLALADDDPRAVILVQQVWDYMTNSGSLGDLGFPMIPWARMGITGANFSGGQYNTTEDGYASVAVALTNSINGTPPPDISGTFISAMASYYSFLNYPNLSLNLSWIASSQADGSMPYYGFLAAYLFPSAAESKYFLGYNTAGDSSGGRILDSSSNVTTGSTYGGFGYEQDIFTFYNPNPSARLAYASQPTQYVWKTPDLTYAQCVSTYGSSNCVQNQIWQLMQSRTNWTTTANVLQMEAGWASEGQDHTDYAIPGAYKYLQNNVYMVGGSSLYADPGLYNNPSTAMSFDANMIDIGTGYNYWTSYGPITNWAGSTNYGDSLSRYVYVAVDMSGAFTTPPTRAKRHLVHFKETSEYIVSYDDVSAPAGTLQSYWHYQNNGSTCASVMTTYQTTAPFMAANTIGTQRFISEFLSLTPNGIALTRDATNFSYTGQKTLCSGATCSCRVRTCASSDGATCNSSATTYEAIAVHLPTSSSGSMPTITQPTCTGTGGNCAAVQIADSSSPKVAMFARQGALIAGASFTSTHSGTAQYVLAGLATGTWTVTVGGTGVTGSPFTVNANDNTLYFESTAGAVVASRTAAPN